jgi:arginine-tRNA-protein transferase
MLDKALICPYLENKIAQNEYFLSDFIDSVEFDSLLQNGWRRFAHYYFRPACQNCRECIPIRINAHRFKISKSQRRNLRKNSDIKVSIESKKYSEEMYQIYKKHSSERFNESTNKNIFIKTHFSDSTDSFQILYSLNEKLIAVSFLDASFQGLSSSYFFYDTDFLKRGLGTFSALTEINLVKELNLNHYYLGYYIKENHFMAFKSKFRPNERLNWNLNLWEEFEK